MAKTLTIKIDLDKMDNNALYLYEVLEDTAGRITMNTYKAGKWRNGKGKAEGFYAPECGTWEVRDE